MLLMEGAWYAFNGGRYKILLFFFRKGFIGAPTVAVGKENNKFPCWQGVSWFLIQGEECVQGSGWKSGLDGLPTPLVVPYTADLVQYPAFVPSPLLLVQVPQNGSFFPWSLFKIFVQNLPQLSKHAVIFMEKLGSSMEKTSHLLHGKRKSSLCALERGQK